MSDSVKRLAEKSKFDEFSTRKLLDLIGTVEDVVDALGFCLSEEEDLLSQWRGYADDGRGVSVGFNTDYLEELSTASRGDTAKSFSLRKLEYAADAHDRLVEPVFESFQKIIASGTIRHPLWHQIVASGSFEDISKHIQTVSEAGAPLLEAQLRLVPKLFQLKSGAFQEEKEWRLFTTLFRPFAPYTEYRARGSQIVPYRTYHLDALKIGAIERVVLGPKHRTPVHVVQDFLGNSGFPRVRVVRSAATYQ